MKKLTMMEKIEFMKDIKIAKIGVLCKYGFGVEDIARLMDMRIPKVRKIIRENGFEES